MAHRDSLRGAATCPKLGADPEVAGCAKNDAIDLACVKTR